MPALCTRRSDLLDALLSALPPERIRLGHDFESFEHHKASVRVNFSGSVSSGGVSAEHELRYRCRWCPLARPLQLLGVHEPIYRGYTIWRGLARLRGAVPSGSNSETWGRGKRFGILNTGGDRFTWYATANTDSGHVDSSEGRQGELLRMFAGWHEPVERLIGATDEGSILKNWRLRSRTAEALGTRTRSCCSAMPPIRVRQISDWEVAWLSKTPLSLRNRFV